ncbi:hypothetical protein OS242_16625 [Tumebacillus sp. DT12]|uniref:Uncharacterized protein n=1 Tax=Tumebacillus lacus TaxID=2995335 RepID=A0ABT3X3W4_9BACL|nr:hypothetical protein [Tumebacillus lacus]MCX7571575.1 hypothetical protein [Tumebacillus lacus]
MLTDDALETGGVTFGSASFTVPQFGPVLTGAPANDKMIRRSYGEYLRPDKHTQGDEEDLPRQNSNLHRYNRGIDPVYRITVDVQNDEEAKIAMDTMKKHGGLVEREQGGQVSDTTGMTTSDGTATGGSTVSRASADDMNAGARHEGSQAARTGGMTGAEDEGATEADLLTDGGVSDLVAADPGVIDPISIAAMLTPGGVPAPLVGMYGEEKENREVQNGAEEADRANATNATRADDTVETSYHTANLTDPYPYDQMDARDASFFTSANAGYGTAEDGKLTYNVGHDTLEPPGDERKDGVPQVTSEERRRSARRDGYTLDPLAPLSPQNFVDPNIGYGDFNLIDPLALSPDVEDSTPGH